MILLPPLETNLDRNPIPFTHGLASGLAKKAKQLDGQNHDFPHCLTLLIVQKVVSFVGMIWTILNLIGPHSDELRDLLHGDKWQNGPKMVIIQDFFPEGIS